MENIPNWVKTLVILLIGYAIGSLQGGCYSLEKRGSSGSQMWRVNKFTGQVTLCVYKNATGVDCRDWCSLVSHFAVFVMLLQGTFDRVRKHLEVQKRVAPRGRECTKNGTKKARMQIMQALKRKIELGKIGAYKKGVDGRRWHLWHLKKDVARLDKKEIHWDRWRHKKRELSQSVAYRKNLSKPIVRGRWEMLRYNRFKH